MPLIKSDQAPATAVPFTMTDIEAAAKRMLIRARQQADALLAEAQAQGEAIRRQMREQGLAEGRAQGLAEGREQGREEGRAEALAAQEQSLRELQATLAEMLRQFEASRSELASCALREVIELAAAIARRVTRRQAAIDPGVLEANLADTMRLVVHQADLRIVIHPSQRAVLDDVLSRLGLEWPGLAHARVVEDESVSVGGCRLMTAHGEIDADIEGQLDRVIAELLPDAG